MRRLLPFALVALLALTLLPGLAAIEAVDTREARDAVVARESARGYDWFAPGYAGEPWFEKTLVGYAPELIALRLLHRIVPATPVGVTDVACSRAVRAALAAAIALVVALIGTRAFGWRAGGLAACALASSVGLPLAARADGTQLLATLCSWLGAGGMLALVRGRSRGALVTRLATWLSLGAAALAGGPLSALWPLLGFLLYFRAARVRDGWREIQPFAGLLVVAGLALPWYGLMVALHGPRFLAHAVWFPYGMEPRGSWLAGPLLALSFALVLGFPWTPLLGASLRDAAERLRAPRTGAPPDLRDSRRASSLVLTLLFAAGVPVALYPGPPLTAALPTLPALAILCGRFLDRVLDGDIDARHLTAATRWCAFLGTVAALFAAVLAGAMAPAAQSLRLLGTVVFAASWTPLLADVLGRRRTAAAFFALPVAFGAPVLETRVLPAMEPWLNTRAVTEAMDRTAPPQAPLVLLEPAPASLRLLLAHNLVVVPDAADAMGVEPTLAARDGYIYLAYRPGREREVARDVARPLQVIARTPTLLLARVTAPVPVPGRHRAP